MDYIIQTGDYVEVNFHNSKFTLTKKARAIYTPESPGDTWIIKDMETGIIHHIGEPCTVSLLKKKE